MLQFYVSDINSYGFTGSLDGTVRIWEVETGRCLKLWEIGEAVTHVAWNPNPDYSVLAISV